MNVVEIAAQGDHGIVSSAWNDRFVLPEYSETGTFARTVIETLVDFFASSNGGTYLDIGANIGLTTIPIARNPAVHCFAFEPEPVNFGFLRRNVARNAPGGIVEFHQVALFDQRGSMSLAIADGNIGDHRLTHGSVAGRNSVTVPTVPLDDFLPRIRGDLAIKVDTQGAEPFVVAGGQEVLARANLLAIEFCPYLMRQLGGDPGILIQTLRGFDQIAIMKGGVAERPAYCGPGEAEMVLRRKLQTAANTDGDYVDVLALRHKSKA